MTDHETETVAPDDPTPETATDDLADLVDHVGHDQDEDEEGTEDDEQDAPPIAQDHRTPEQIEAAVKSWERERDRHMRELEKRDDVRYRDSAVCVLCDGHGLIYPVLPEPENSARRQYVYDALGGPPEIEYLAHPTESICRACDGYGQVYTGSKVPNQDLLNCPSCGGMGHRPPQGQPGQVYEFTQTGNPVEAQVTLSSDPDAGLPYSTVPMAEQMRIGRDAYGRQAPHQHFGVPRVAASA